MRKQVLTRQQHSVIPSLSLCYMPSEMCIMCSTSVNFLAYRSYIMQSYTISGPKNTVFATCVALQRRVESVGVDHMGGLECIGLNM